MLLIMIFLLLSYNVMVFRSHLIIGLEVVFLIENRECFIMDLSRRLNISTVLYHRVVV